MRPPPARLRKDLSQASTAEWLFGDATPIVPHFHGVSYPRVYCILGYRSIIYTNLNSLAMGTLGFRRNHPLQALEPAKVAVEGYDHAGMFHREGGQEGVRN